MASLLTVLAVVPLLAQPNADATFVAETRDYLQRLEKLGFAGAVLVARGGTPLLAEGYGLADRERKVAWTPGTVAPVGSITKQFTAAAILRFAEKEQLRVTDPITKYFDGVPEDKRGITLHQLLTHSSGIVDLDGAGDWDPIGREEFVRRIFAQPLAFAPGTSYQYSNAGYSLLGAILEKLSGKSYEQVLREQFFVPLGIYETGYILAPWGEGRVAQGYRHSELWGTVLGRPIAEDGPYWVLRANGGIHSTLWDMLRWSRALLEERALSRASLELLWKPHVREGADANSHYGYGWTVQQHGAMKVVTHNGSNGIYYADLAIIPENGTVIFMTTNVATANRYTRNLLESIGFRLVAGRPYPEVPRVVAADPAHLRELAGEWVLAGGGAIRTVAENDALVVEPLDRRAFARLFSTSHDDADLRLVEQRGQRLLEAMRALLKKDFSPLQRLYGSDVTVERLAAAWGGRLAEVAEQHGALRDFELIGGARRDDRHHLLVRLHAERGAQDYTFVWDAARDGKLLGITGANLETRLPFFAEASGGWASFDRTSGASMPLRVEEGRLVLGRGEGAIRAERKAAGR